VEEPSWTSAGCFSSAIARVCTEVAADAEVCDGAVFAARCFGDAVRE
jgi:hypothetical protein